MSKRQEERHVADNWNDKVIAEFRANEGRVGGIYDEQARRYPGFADYARQTAGVRTIPVLALRRS
jgi:hypothetical protein